MPSPHLHTPHTSSPTCPALTLKGKVCGRTLMYFDWKGKRIYEPLCGIHGRQLRSEYAYEFVERTKEYQEDIDRWNGVIHEMEEQSRRDRQRRKLEKAGLSNPHICRIITFRQKEIK